MLVLLSCAKTMSAVSKMKVPLTTSPRFQKEAAEIALHTCTSGNFQYSVP